MEATNTKFDCQDRQEADHSIPQTFTSEGLQVSPGVLNDIQVGRFKTILEDFAELNIGSIQPCSVIPDYKDPTESITPIVVQSPAACYCIDGWDLIGQAKTSGKSTIRCFVFHIQDHSDTELAIRKVAIRSKPQGGTYSYAELVRNTRLLSQIIMEESKNPIIFSHGGARRGSGFTNNRDDDVREILAERLGKNRTTINKCLQHGKYLSHEALNALVDAEVPKGLFEATQESKQSYATELIRSQTSSDEIVKLVSARMYDWVKQWQTSIDPEVRPPESGTEQQTPLPSQTIIRRTAHTSKTGKAPELKTWKGNEPWIDDGITAEEHIRSQLRRIAEELLKIADNREVSAEQLMTVLRDRIAELAKIIQQLAHLNAKKIENTEGKV
jgi:hypothetical protein